MNASGGVPGCAIIKSDMYKNYEGGLATNMMSTT